MHLLSRTQICAQLCSGTKEVLVLSDGFSDVDGFGVSEVDGFVDVETLGTRLGDVESPLLVDSEVWLLQPAMPSAIKVIKLANSIFEFFFFIIKFPFS